MKYAGPFRTRADAKAAAEATCRGFARSRSEAYPIPATRYIGRKPVHWHDRPEHYATHSLSEPLVTRAGDYMLEVTPEMETVPAGSEVVDGKSVDVVRVGAEVDANTWPDGFELRAAAKARSNKPKDRR